MHLFNLFKEFEPTNSEKCFYFIYLFLVWNFDRSLSSTALDGRMISEWCVRKEAVMAYSEVLSGICIEEVSKTTNNLR